MPLSLQDIATVLKDVLAAMGCPATISLRTDDDTHYFEARLAKKLPDKLEADGGVRVMMQLLTAKLGIANNVPHTGFELYAPTSKGPDINKIPDSLLNSWLKELNVARSAGSTHFESTIELTIKTARIGLKRGIDEISVRQRIPKASTKTPTGKAKRPATTSAAKAKAGAKPAKKPAAPASRSGAGKAATKAAARKQTKSTK